jgi:hypothetical protein
VKKKTYYYCTCSTDPNKRRLASLGKTPFREVEADSEGICNDCKHYAVAFHKRIDTGYKEFYNMLNPKPQEDGGYTKGGLSLISQEKCKVSKGKNEKGRTKKGNLDI